MGQGSNRSSDNSSRIPVPIRCGPFMPANIRRNMATIVPIALRVCATAQKSAARVVILYNSATYLAYYMYISLLLTAALRFVVSRQLLTSMAKLRLVLSGNPSTSYQCLFPQRRIQFLSGRYTLHNAPPTSKETY